MKETVIEIVRSAKTDCRPIDGKIDEVKLLNATVAHQDAVLDGAIFFANKLVKNVEQHDYTKILYFEDFHKALESGQIKKHIWYQKHVMEERHHLLSKAPDNVNLLDILEYISDCTMAAAARSDKMYSIKLPSKLLQKAFDNTVELVRQQVVITEEEENGDA